MTSPPSPSFRTPKFIGTHQNRRDAKGRVSVPASFRGVLRAQDPTGAIIVRQSDVRPCIEAWAEAIFERLATPLETLQGFTREYDDMSASLYAGGFSIEADKEGRIILPETLAAEAGITDAVTFTGNGLYFQMWEPGAELLRREELARQRAAKAGLA